MSGVLSTGGGSIGGAGVGKLPRWKGKRIGRYRLVDLLGKGSYGRVFLADDVDLRRQVALKIISAETTANNLREGQEKQSPTQTGGTGTGAPTTEQIESVAAKVVERTLTEARAAARIEHPNVVHVYEVGRLPAPPGSPPGTILGGFISMELLEGGTLQDLIKQHGPMPVSRACALVADAAEALQFAHDQGVVHRDVKPANLMLSRHGKCKVVDFGLAMEHDPDGSRKTPIAGTLMFVAPEVTLGEPPGPKSDQYSLGVSLYALLTGRPPYSGDKQQLLDGHRHGTPPSLRALRPEVPEALELAILRAMEKDPNRRFHSVRQFGQTLRTFTEEGTASDVAASFLPDLFADLEDPTAPPEPVKKAPPPPVQLKPPAPAPRPQNGAVVWPWLVLGAAAVVIMLSLITWAVLSTRGGDEQRQIAQSSPPAPGTVQPQVTSPNPPITSGGSGQAATVANPAGTSLGGSPAPSEGERQPPPQPPKLRNDAQQTPPETEGSESVAPAEPPTKVQPQEPANQSEPPPPLNVGGPTGEQGPATVANEVLMTPLNTMLLLRVASGEDATRPDRRAVVQGRIANVRVNGQLLIAEFSGMRGRELFAVHLDLSRKDVLADIQQKLNTNARDLGLSGKGIRVRGEISRDGERPFMILVSPDQIELLSNDGAAPGPPGPPRGGSASRG